jgi:hypothetical protein
LEETFWLDRVWSIASRPDHTKWTLVESEYAFFKPEEMVLLEHLRPMLVCLLFYHDLKKQKKLAYD